MLFDLFHTLVDVASAPGASQRYTADILGVERERWRRACFSSVHEICRPTVHEEVVGRIAHSIDPAIPRSRIREAAVLRQRRFDHALLNVEASVVAALRELRERGKRLVLVSNASSGEVSAWARSPLAPWFDAVLFSSECGLRKPQEAIYRLALKRAGASAGAALFVGDGGSDEHRGARRVGIGTVLTTTWLSEEQVRQRRAHADVEIAHVAELPGLLGDGNKDEADAG